MNNAKPIRIIPILEIKNGLLIKGINLEGLRVLGSAKKFANLYYKHGADEICYIDNVATLYNTKNLNSFVTMTAENIFIPLSVGGGIRSLKDINDMLVAGADKICINSAAINNIKFLETDSKKVGSSNITIIIQAIKIDNKYFISKSNGRDLVKIDPLIWAKKVEDYGAGEIIITSVNNEGLKKGFDIRLVDGISKKVNVPVIAHGGAGNFKHIYDVIKKTNISGVGLSSILHYEAINNFSISKLKIGNTNFVNNFKRSNKRRNVIDKLKKYLKKRKIKVRDE